MPGLQAERQPLRRHQPAGPGVAERAEAGRAPLARAGLLLVVAAPAQQRQADAGRLRSSTAAGCRSARRRAPAAPGWRGSVAARLFSSAKASARGRSTNAAGVERARQLGAPEPAVRQQATVARGVAAGAERAADREAGADAPGRLGLDHVAQAGDAQRGAVGRQLVVEALELEIDALGRRPALHRRQVRQRAGRQRVGAALERACRPTALAASAPRRRATRRRGSR